MIVFLQHAIQTFNNNDNQLGIIKTVVHTHYVLSLHLPISSEQYHALDTSEYASQSAANSSEYPLIFWSTPSPPKAILCNTWHSIFFSSHQTKQQPFKPNRNRLSYNVLWLFATGLKHVYVPERDKAKQIKSLGPNANSYLT